MSTAVEKPLVLLVDDEPQVLEGLTRNLRGGFRIVTAVSGEAGLALLASNPGTAVVMSDMRMPGMNGAAFLAQARTMAPDSVRILLTGESDLEAAIAAVNEGSIFRFLRKPCPPDLLKSTLLAAAAQHRLVVAERELLDLTLRGAVRALCDTLAVTSPTVFGAATRVKATVLALADKLGMAVSWQLEIASLVTELGAITLPAGLYERRARRGALSPAERAMLDRIPAVTEQILATIPRLEPVRALVRASRIGVVEPAAHPREASVLRLALALEELETVATTSDAIEILRGQQHETELVDALRQLHEATTQGALEVPVARLCEGMRLAADVLSKTGVLVVGRGHVVTPSIADRLRNFLPSLASDTVLIVADPCVRAA